MMLTSVGLGLCTGALIHQALSLSFARTRADGLARLAAAAQSLDAIVDASVKCKPPIAPVDQRASLDQIHNHTHLPLVVSGVKDAWNSAIASLISVFTK
ncbi:MAG: hypothetical protein SGCHY_003478 [Lobulomycetales sp.]